MRRAAEIDVVLSLKSFDNHYLYFSCMMLDIFFES